MYLSTYYEGESIGLGLQASVSATAAETVAKKGMTRTASLISCILNKRCDATCQTCLDWISSWISASSLECWESIRSGF
jgi:hypothetical protein